MAHHLGVSPQCIDSYANGRAHPQIMKFVLIVEFISEYRRDGFESILLDAIKYIKKDQIEHAKTIQQINIAQISTNPRKKNQTAQRNKNKF